MPSMSRCGCIGHAAPGTRRSSLNTRRSPSPMFASSQYWSKLKCQFALNHPPSAWNSERRGRRTTAMLGLVFHPMAAAVLYAKSGDIHVAYSVRGAGPDMVWCPGSLSHQEIWPHVPEFAGMLDGMAQFARVIFFDKRGTGM